MGASCAWQAKAQRSSPSPEFRGLIENAENLKNIESARRDLGGEAAVG